jgi:CYTH domain-containing protein
MTKKFPVNENDISEQEEHTIILSEEEFKNLFKAGGKKIRKIRYYYDVPEGPSAEIDIFKDKLEGLAVVDFEFKTREEKRNFMPPDFCLAEITPDVAIAGGILAGGEYSKIEDHLKRYNYKKIL